MNMKKQRKQLIILVILLAALAAGYFGLAGYNRRQQEREPEQAQGEVLTDIAADDIQRFSYEFNGEVCSFERTPEGLWISSADSSLNLIQSRLDAMAEKLTGITAQSIFTDVTDMSQYGLEQPSNILRWETAQASYAYCIGDYNSLAKVYYICEPDSHTVYAVTAPLGTGFDYSLEELVEEESDGSGESGVE